MTRLELLHINKIILDGIESYNEKFKEEVLEFSDETLNFIKPVDLIVMYKYGMDALLNSCAQVAKEK